MPERAKPRSKPATGTISEARQRVLDAAARLFRQQGYASTSMRDIAAEVGIQAASLYSHFASKDEIVGEVLRLGVEQVFNDVRTAVTALGPEADARLVLRTAIHAHLLAFWERQDYTSANVRIFGQLPTHLRDAHLPTRDAYERYWDSLLKQGVRQGLLEPRRNLKLARLFLLTALNGSLDWFQGNAASVRSVANELTGLLLDGLAGQKGQASGTLALMPPPIRPIPSNLSIRKRSTRAAS